MLHYVHLVVWLVVAVHLSYAFVEKFTYFDKRIQCFSMDRHNVIGELHIETIGEIVILNEELLSGRKRPLDNETRTINRIDSSAANRTTRPAALSRVCTLQSGTYAKTFSMAYNHSSEKSAHLCNSGLNFTDVYTFTVKEYTFSVIAVKGHDNTTVETRLMRQHNAENCSTNSGDALYCKVPRPNTNASFSYFTKASTAVVTEYQNGSYSLFVAFDKRIKSTTYSVICEYKLFTDHHLQNKMSERAILSAVWSSESAATVLVPMRLETSEILIVAEKDRIKMLWLPLVNNTDKPQPVFSRPLRRDDDELSSPDEIEVTGVLPSRNMTEIYVTTDHTIFAVRLDKCSPYANCTECLVSAPSYCGWCPEQNRCTFERLCNRKSNESKTKNWFESATSNDTVYCKRNTTIPLTFRNRSSDLPQRSTSTRSTKKANSLQRNQRLTEMPSWPERSLKEKTPSAKRFNTEDQVLEIILWISAALAIIMLILVAVVSMMYFKTKKENEATFDGFKKRYSQCQGIESYRKLKDVLWRRSMRYPYKRQNVFTEEDEDSETSTST